ncbi:hypothetical protein BDN72DRAFT_906185 [Pluteus cervinus]|uniref:Uncharacterized protein n=1 Tax=Pluteus cervinus TaxID=181527 RepID=A0ACD3A0B5_9AGAR|nr:hypothetical protein BDN72DRAFT_906185 [Pluteus cervinus]
MPGSATAHRANVSASSAPEACPFVAPPEAYAALRTPFIEYMERMFPAPNNDVDGPSRDLEAPVGDSTQLSQVPAGSIADASSPCAGDGDALEAPVGDSTKSPQDPVGSIPDASSADAGDGDANAEDFVVVEDVEDFVMVDDFDNNEPCRGFKPVRLRRRSSTIYSDDDQDINAPTSPPRSSSPPASPPPSVSPCQSSVASASPGVPASRGEDFEMISASPITPAPPPAAPGNEASPPPATTSRPPVTYRGRKRKAVPAKPVDQENEETATEASGMRRSRRFQASTYSNTAVTIRR